MAIKLFSPDEFDAVRAAQLNATMKQVSQKYKQPERQVHVCSVCGKSDFWKDGWSWWGTLDNTTAKACSEECRQKFNASSVPKESEREFIKDDWTTKKGTP